MWAVIGRGFGTAVAVLALAAAGTLAPAAALAQAPAGKGLPRVMVLTFGRGDQGRDEQAAKIQGIAEETLLSYQIPLVDETQVLSAYQLEDLEKFLLLTPERSRIAELKARFGCEVLCVVQFTRNFQYEKEILGTRQRFYKTDVRVKGILPDTAEVIHSSGGESTIEARTTQMENLAREHVQRLAEKILARPAAEAEQGTKIEVLAKGFDHTGLGKLTAAVRAFPQTIEIAERNFGAQPVGEKNALFEVRWRGTPDELRSALARCPDPTVDIIAATPNRITVVPFEGLGMSFLAPPEGAVVPGPQVDAVVQVTGSSQPLDVTIGDARAERDQAGNYFARVTVAPGENVIVARASHSSGRSAEARRRVVVDREPPAVQILAPRPGLSNRRVQDVIVAAKDDGVVTKVQVNGREAQRGEDGRWHARLELPEGPSEIVATALDGAGRTGEARITLTIDSTPPELEGKIVAIIEGRVEPGSTVTCDGRPVELNPDGTFRFSVEGYPGSSVTLVATDSAGNRTEKVYKIGAAAGGN